MSWMSEYINKKLSHADLERELMRLISAYNKETSRYLLVYASCLSKRIPEVSLSQDDFYIISDMLRGKESHENLDFYLETPGGSGETAEEIVNFIRAHFKELKFVISGEAKSAGTLMVMAGDEILMTETGSLGPLDAQLKIGRSVISAYDYMEWIDQKQKEADTNKKLNPFDAIMVAQVSPGELKGVYHSLHFAKDLVVEWLQKYKFKNWKVTETRKISVTDQMRKERAHEIADELINHAKWRSHGRSIKIDDLESIKLKITKLDDDKNLSEIVYRIQTVCMLLFKTTSTYKIFATQDEKIFAQASPGGAPINIKKLPQLPDVGEGEITCKKCGKTHRIYAKFKDNPQIDNDLQKKGLKPFPKNNKFQCDCGESIDLSELRKEIERQAGARIIA